MKNRGMCFCLNLLLCVVLLFSGCGKEETKKQNTEKETMIPVTFLVNPDTGENENEELVAEFNEEYEGQYQLNVEWITDTAEGYRSRIKTMNGLDKLPAVITDIGFDADFYNMLVVNERVVDMALSGDASMSYGGFYYNKELFEQAGIQEFPKDWHGFFACLDTLKAAGITPLAIHGGSSYWTSLLIATGYTAGTAKGLQFLETQYPQDYDNQSARDLFAMVKRLYNYADPDALHIERTEAAKRFTEGKAAITANGGWMIVNFTKEEKEKIGFAPFPGDVLLKDMKMSTWAVTKGHSEEVTEGAKEFLDFREQRDKKQEKEYFAAPAEGLVEQEYKQVILQAQTIMPNYQLKWESGIQEEFLVNSLPLYIEDEMSQEQFLEGLNEAVQKINAEK